jgi:AraC family transcriptional regulator
LLFNYHELADLDLYTGSVSEPLITEDAGRFLVGMCQRMAISEMTTSALWKRFMPRRGEVTGRKSVELISATEYPEDYFTVFNPHKPFVKWAGAEVMEVDQIPPGMQALEIPAGLFAVFHYRGLPSDRSIYEYIYGVWLPSSAYRLDHRPHFEVLGEKYNNQDAQSEEEIWIPVRMAEN